MSAPQRLIGIVLFTLSRYSQSSSLLETKHLASEYCPTLHIYNNTCQKCVCLSNALLSSRILTCNRSVSIMHTYCITLDDEKDVYEVGSCLFNSAQYHKSGQLNSIYFPVTLNKTALNNSTCNKYGRSGRLCGKCANGKFPLGYSYDLTCVVCNDFKLNIVKYVLAAFGPLTIFFVIILCCNINVTTSSLHGYVLFSQIITLPSLMRLYSVSDINHDNQWNFFFKIVMNMYSMWNLDFFRFFYSSVCLRLHPIQVLALDYTLAVYPLFLTVLLYIMVLLHMYNCRLMIRICNPINLLLSWCKTHGNTRTSLIDTFVTFFVLSMVKFLNVSFDLLIPVSIQTINHNGTIHKLNALYFNPSYEYFETEHLPYAVMAVFTSTIFVVFPILLMLLYPFSTFHSLLNHIPVPPQLLNALLTFVDKFQGIYRNGTEGNKKSRDCRYFAALFLILRVLIFLIISLTEATLCLIMCGFLLYGYVILLIIVRPYKQSYSRQGTIDTLCVLLLAVTVTSQNCTNIAAIKDQSQQGHFMVVGGIVSIIPCFCFVCAIIYKGIFWIYSYYNNSFRKLRN